MSSLKDAVNRFWMLLLQNPGMPFITVEVIVEATADVSHIEQISFVLKYVCT